MFAEANSVPCAPGRGQGRCRYVAADHPTEHPATGWVSLFSPIHYIPYYTINTICIHYIITAIPWFSLVTTLLSNTERNWLKSPNFPSTNKENVVSEFISWVHMFKKKIYQCRGLSFFVLFECYHWYYAMSLQHKSMTNKWLYPIRK